MRLFEAGDAEGLALFLQAEALQEPAHAGVGVAHAQVRLNPAPRVLGAQEGLDAGALEQGALLGLAESRDAAAVLAAPYLGDAAARVPGEPALHRGGGGADGARGGVRRGAAAHEPE